MIEPPIWTKKGVTLFGLNIKNTPQKHPGQIYAIFRMIHVSKFAYQPGIVRKVVGIKWCDHRTRVASEQNRLIVPGIVRYM